MNDNRIKLAIHREHAEPNEGAQTPKRSIANADLDKVSAGLSVGTIGGVDNTFRDVWVEKSRFRLISPQVTAYRNAECPVVPGNRRSVTVIYHELTAEPVAGQK